MVDLVGAYAHLASTDIPKLFINADPGSILVGKQRENPRRSMPAMSEQFADFTVHDAAKICASPKRHEGTFFTYDDNTGF